MTMMVVIMNNKGYNGGCIIKSDMMMGIRRVRIVRLYHVARCQP